MESIPSLIVSHLRANTSMDLERATVSSATRMVTGMRDHGHRIRDMAKPSTTLPMVMSRLADLKMAISWSGFEDEGELIYKSKTPNELF